MVRFMGPTKFPAKPQLLLLFLPGKKLFPEKENIFPIQKKIPCSSSSSSSSSSRVFKNHLWRTPAQIP